MECLNIIFQIIGAIGSLATIGAFIFLFRRDKDKQAQIDALKKLGMIEEKKLRLCVLPELELNGIMCNELELQIDLTNKGEETILVEFNIISNEIALHSNSLPYTLNKGQKRYTYGRVKQGQDVQKSAYEIDIIYLDKLKNKYSTKIRGKGGSATVVETKEI